VVHKALMKYRGCDIMRHR